MSNCKHCDKASCNNDDNSTHHIKYKIIELGYKAQVDHSLNSPFKIGDRVYLPNTNERGTVVQNRFKSCGVHIDGQPQDKVSFFEFRFIQREVENV